MAVKSSEFYRLIANSKRSGERVNELDAHFSLSFIWCHFMKDTLEHNKLKFIGFLAEYNRLIYDQHQHPYAEHE